MIYLIISKLRIVDRVSNPSTRKLIIAHRPTKLPRNRTDSRMTTVQGKGCKRNVLRFKLPQDEEALKGLEKYGETIIQRIRQRQGCEEKQAICLYAVGRRRRRRRKRRRRFITY